MKRKGVFPVTTKNAFFSFKQHIQHEHICRIQPSYEGVREVSKQVHEQREQAKPAKQV